MSRGFEFESWKEKGAIFGGRIHGRWFIWTATNARKAGKCSATGQPYYKGARIWRPITNGDCRMLRVLDSHIQEIAQ